MNLSLNSDPLTRYPSRLRGESNLNGLPKSLMKCNATHIAETKMGRNKRLPRNVIITHNSILNCLYNDTESYVNKFLYNLLAVLFFSVDHISLR